MYKNKKGYSMRYLFMCRSLTYAQRAARSLERGGVNTGVVKAPQPLSGNGCGYCVSVSFKNGGKAAAILRGEGLLQGKIYEQQPDGSFREVLL